MILRLHREFAPRIQRWIARCAVEGIDVIITQGWRPVAYQQELLDCWNDPTNDYECRKRRGIVVQPARPGTSFHNPARAIDGAIIPPDKLGRAAAIAAEEGIFWGGLLSTPDTVHWDDRLNITIAEAMRRFTEADLVDFATIPIIGGRPIYTDGH